MSQAPLFPDHLHETPQTRAPEGRKRLRGQNAKILARLRRGKASNTELAIYSLKYTSRISDIRAHLKERGETIKCTRGEGGICWYEIVKVNDG